MARRSNLLDGINWLDEINRTELRGAVSSAFRKRDELRGPVSSASRSAELEIDQSYKEFIAHITRRATDQSVSTPAQLQSPSLERMQRKNDVGASVSTPAQMQSPSLERMQREIDLLRSQLAASEGKAAHFQRAWQESEAAKETIEAEARERFEREKAVLEVSMREELHACQICEVNRRNVVILPCFHGQYCAQCLERHQRNSNTTCPACRGTIRGTVPYIA